MSVMDVLIDSFPAGSVNRGYDLFQRGLVRITHMNTDEVAASVRDGRERNVRIKHNGNGAVYCGCDCDESEIRDINCKHIWATMLAAATKKWAPLLMSLDANAPSDGLLEMLGGSLMSLPGFMRKSKPASQPKPRPEPWKRALSELKQAMQYDGPRPPAPVWPQGREIFYVIDISPHPYREAAGEIVIDIHTRQPRKDGTPGKPKPATLSGWEWMTAPDAADRSIGQLLLGAQANGYHSGLARQFSVPSWAHDTTLKAICQTGRCMLRTEPPPTEMRPLQWDDGEPWEFFVEVKSAERGFMASGALRRPDDQRMDLSECVMVTKDELLIARDRISRLRHHGAIKMLKMMRIGGPLEISAAGVGEFAKHLYALKAVPKIEWSEQTDVIESRAKPRPILKLKAPTSGQGSMLFAELLYDYDGVPVAAALPGSAMVHPAQRRVLIRDVDAEQAAASRLQQLGVREQWDYYGNRNDKVLRLEQKHLARAVIELTAENWRIEADGKLYRTPGELQVSVSSGIDWFELNGKVDFGDQVIALPALLAALENGENTVVLDDGTLGILPEEWLKRYTTLAGLGEAKGETLRFTRAQAGFLDALLASMPEARCDEAFERVRNDLKNFTRIESLPAPEQFRGALRPYQNEALGWFSFLDRFSFGGCLADDMGLGKTVEVLAHLAGRKGVASAPSLVVAPRSLVFNWKQEAARFAPDLRVLDQSGSDRVRDTSHLADYDLVLTTYGTLRRDAAYFKDFCFDYAILDEAQAIKNAGTQAAKAARLLRANRRLALSGTPIENRLADLWSLFEFLNPGMLGSAGVFRTLSMIGAEPSSAATDNAAAAPGRAIIARALRPFILRRTKAQVASELPERVEQTLYCDLEDEQRKRYDELRDHYRQALLGQIDKVGMARSKIQVLTALLRLRQAACHPGLIDRKHLNAPSAKLDALRQQVDEVLAEGHKALIFSQFTSLLAIVKKDLDNRGLTYEYLDGKTKDRQERVERFQSDPACKLFLISLKAGGVGLNLTAADYVFLLDPWWNPAVEAQAVDRAHRIGQQRTVFAYRLIARGTVEEKVLELQQSKRNLADAIINEDNSLIAAMGREELELLLS